MFFMIKEYFLKNAKDHLQLSETELSLLNHGIDIIINDGINYLFVILLSLFLRDGIRGLLYLICFRLLRIYSGGWHAKTKAGCFLSFQIMYLMAGFFIKNQILMSFNIYISFFCTLYMILVGPVEHIYNPLTQNERTHNHRFLILNCLLLMMIDMFLYFSYRNLSQTVCIVMIYNVFMMELLKHSKYGRKV